VTLAPGTQVMRVAFDANGPAGRVGHFDQFDFSRLLGGPAAPSGVTAAAPSPTTARVGWVDNSADETGFRVQWSGSPDFAAVTSVDVPADTTMFDMPVASHGGRRYYRVLAVRGGVTSSASNVAEVAQVFVSDFGAVGDGLADDRAAVQRAIDAAADDAVLVFGAGGTYRLDGGLVVRKPLNVEANGATLKLNESNYPQNMTIRVESEYAADMYTWEGAVSAGQTTFAVAVPGSALQPGDLVFVEFGDDPYDFEWIEPHRPWIEHYSVTSRVVANDGTSVTLDAPVPYDIHPGVGEQYRPHRIRRITKSAEGLWMNNLRFDHFAGTTPNGEIWLQTTRDVLVQNVTGRYTLLLQAWDSDDVLLKGVRGDLVEAPNNTADGRVLSVLQTDRVTMEDVEVTTAVDGPVVFGETWARDTRLLDVTVHWRHPERTTAAVLFFTGGSTGTFVDNLLVDNAGYGEINLIDKGGTSGVAQWHLGRVEINGPIFWATLNNIDVLVADGRTYDASKVVTEEHVIALEPDMTGYVAPTLSGVVRRATFRLSNSMGYALDPAVMSVEVQDVWMVNNLWQGDNVANHIELFSGQTVEYILGYGSVHPFNSLSGQDKRVLTYTGSNLPPGTTLTVTFEYWPAT
jgi:hypothetical protein